MKCLFCNSSCTCTNSHHPADSRVTKMDRIVENKPIVKIRRYRCDRCVSVYFSQEVVTIQNATEKGMDIFRKGQLKQISKRKKTK